MVDAFRPSFVGALTLGVLVIAPLPARAGESVQLRPAPVAHGPSITLGDLFAHADYAAGQIIVGHASPGGGQSVLEAPRVQAIARNAGLDWSNSSGLRRIIVTGVRSSPSQATDPVSSAHDGTTGLRNIASRAQSLVYTRNLMAGELISASDLKWSDEAVASSISLGDPDLAVGKAARRPLRAGAPVEPYDLLTPKVVHRDEVVTVAFESDGVTLTLEARALSDAGVGDVLQVVNPQSKKVIQTIVSGPGAALIGPRADLIRAATFDPALRTASLR